MGEHLLETLINDSYGSWGMPEPVLSFRDPGKVVYSNKIALRDVYSLDYLYTLMHEWLLEYGYCGSDEDFKEIMYEHIDGGRGAELWIKWRLSKSAVVTFAPLFSYNVDINFHIMGQKEVEVVLGGKKVKADRGEVEIEIVGYMVLDPKKKVKSHWLGQHFYDFIFTVLLKGKAKMNERGLQGDLARFQEAIKSYLKLETYLPERELSSIYQKRDLT